MVPQNEAMIWGHIPYSAQRQVMQAFGNSFIASLNKLWKKSGVAGDT